MVFLTFNVYISLMNIVNKTLTLYLLHKHYGCIFSVHSDGDFTKIEIAISRPT